MPEIGHVDREAPGPSDPIVHHAEEPRCRQYTSTDEAKLMDSTDHEWLLNANSRSSKRELLTAEVLGPKV